MATAAGKSPGWLLRAAIRNLLAPAALPVTLAALVALMPARVRERAGGALLGLGASPEARLMYRLAPGVLLLTAALWRWHPWEMRYKWSLYLHALSAVLVLRMAVDLWDWLVVTASRRGLGRRAEAVGAVLAAVVAVGLSFHLTTARRIHGVDLTPALGFIEGQPLGPGSVAVGTHAYPVLRYLAEAGPFRGRLPYPTAFRLPSWRGAEAADRPRHATHACVRNARRAGASSPGTPLPPGPVLAAARVPRRARPPGGGSRPGPGDFASPVIG